KGDLDKFFQLLDLRLNIAKESLMHRYSVLKNLRVKDLPFVAGQGLMKGAENLSADDSIEPILKQGTWGIGFIGLAETLIALTGKHHGEDESVRELGLKIISYVRQYTDRLTEETKLNWSFYATPAEGLSGKFIKQDQKAFGIIKGVTDKDYYTNSYHVPVYYPISIKEKIDIEAPYHKLCNSGHISYLEVDDCPNGEAIMDILHYAYRNTNISYLGINFHIRYCKSCGTYLHNNEFSCVNCGSQDIQGVSRVTGYLSLDERFGPGKNEERSDRVSHLDGNKKSYFCV
ncbi:MAG: anaerobic ribonucleoside-triphosphate reductase, partial [Sarcina sp.]